MMTSRPDVQQKPIQVFIVDDHAVVRHGTAELIRNDPAFDVVGQADSIEHLIDKLTRLQADVLLLDINLPEGNSLKHIPALKSRFASLKILAFSAHAEIQYVDMALKSGADGFLSKLVDENSLRLAILSVFQRTRHDEPVLSEDIKRLIKQREMATQAIHLTAREQEILLQVARGSTNQDMAKEFSLSVKTIDSHVASLIKKAGVANRTQLLSYAYENKLL